MKPPAPWALWICLALGLGFAALIARAPSPSSISAPADAFSASRAMTDVALLAQKTHPIGSAEAEEVRGALVARMAALGLAPQVRTAVGLDQAEFRPGYLAAGTVRNVIGQLSGRNPALPALLLMAHYDTTPNSPGAADDTAGVATVLEIARLLRATGTHARDVIFLITDGEEVGLLGADAFFRSDPLRPHVGLVLNFEARGDAGRTVMFETGPNNGALIDLYARTARHPFANSLTGYVYKRLPNNTDFTYAVNQGLPGLNFAFLGDQLAYHTPLATPAHLSQASLQHMGDQAAPVARALADVAELPARAPDVTYFDLCGVAVIHYAAAVGWGVIAVALALIAVALMRLRRSRALKWAEVIHGLAVALAAVLATVLVTHLSSGLFNSASYAGGYHLLRAFNLLFLGAGLVCLGAVLAVYTVAVRARAVLILIGAALLAGFLSLLSGFDAASWGLVVVLIGLAFVIARKSLSLWGGWLGALALLAGLSILDQAAAPLTSPLFVWPLLIGAAAAAGASFGRVGGWIAGLGAIAALAILGGFAGALFTSIGPTLPEILGLFVALLLAVFAPLLIGWANGRARWLQVAAVFSLGALALLSVGFGQGSAARPELTQALYVAEGAKGPQWRIAPLVQLDAWSRKVLQADGGVITHAALQPFSMTPVWQARAKSRPVEAPRLTVSREGPQATIMATTPPGARTMTLSLRSDRSMKAASVNGVAAGVVMPARTWGQIAYSAPPHAGVSIKLTLDPHASIEAVAFSQSDGWPRGAEPPPKPAGLMAWRSSDTTTVFSRAVSPGS